jgi:hypothetical protein
LRRLCFRRTIRDLDGLLSPEGKLTDADAINRLKAQAAGFAEFVKKDLILM